MQKVLINFFEKFVSKNISRNFVLNFWRKGLITFFSTHTSKHLKMTVFNQEV
jgi:hypothetical protein